ncbi:alpha/beta hydrolase family protein [Planctomycetota bacterium]
MQGVCPLGRVVFSVALLAFCVPSAAVGEGVTGEARSTRVAVDPESDTALVADLLQFDAVPGSPETFSWRLRPVHSSMTGATIYELTFPSPRPSPYEVNNTVWCRFYPAAGVAEGGRAPLAIVLHHLGGSFAAEAILAEFLGRSGIHALEVEFPYYGPRRPKSGKVSKGLMQADFERGIDATRQGVADIRRALDWAISREDVDPERTGLVGVSLGGIIGSLACGVDRRLRRNVLILAGGDMAGILCHPSGETRKVRKILKERKIDVHTLRRTLAPIEPLRFAHRIDPRGVLMLNGRRDEVVPPATTEALWREIGGPAIVWYETGHYTTAVFLLDLFARTRDHFLRGGDLTQTRAGGLEKP